MARMICLANSYKRGGRCIAGIDIDTGEWIRPISRTSSAIGNERFIDGVVGNEPLLLDLLEIPIDGRAPDEGCQPENRYIDGTAWKRLRHLTFNEINHYIEDTLYLLHNQQTKVDPDVFVDMPRNQWKSLQFIRVTNPNFFVDHWKNKKCIFNYSGTQYELKVTDPIVMAKMANCHNISNECLLTISMATPYKSPSYEKPFCWKMVAAVIEL